MLEITEKKERDKAFLMNPSLSVFILFSLRDLLLPSAPPWFLLSLDGRMLCKIAILDTTLRDGERAPGFCMSLDEKLAVARQLARLGVDVIEAGHPGGGSRCFASVREIARVVRDPTIACLARASDEDIDTAWEAVRGAERPRINVVLAASRAYMAKSGMEPARSRAGRPLRCAGRGTTAPRSSSRPRMRRARTLISCAASSRRRSAPGPRCSTCPTASGTRCPTSTPASSGNCAAASPGSRRRRSRLTATTTWAWRSRTPWPQSAPAPGRCQCTVNGLGERAGNAALEEIVMALATRADYLCAFSGADTRSSTATSKLVQAITGFRAQPTRR